MVNHIITAVLVLGLIITNVIQCNNTVVLETELEAELEATKLVQDSLLRHQVHIDTTLQGEKDTTKLLINVVSQWREQEVAKLYELDSLWKTKYLR